MATDDTSNNIEPTTKQVAQTRDEKGRITGGVAPVGFHTNPENISPGGWKKEMVFSYQYRRFMNMTVEELKEYSKTPESKRTVVEDLAYSRVLAAKKSLPDVKEMTDRTEGKPLQSIVSPDGSMTPTVIIENVYGNKPKFRVNNDAEVDDVAKDSSPEPS